MSLHNRYFMPITVAAEAGRRRVHRLVCRECGTIDDISANTHPGTRAAEDLLNIWRRRGWEIGSKPHKDVCPGCASATRKARRERKQDDPHHTAEIIPMPTPTCDPVPAGPPIEAEPPTEMTRDDRRVIFARLQDVYLDEASGYQSNWTDKRVAEDLGVPRAWVAQIRDENFGPEHSNEEIKATLAEMVRWQADIERAVEEGKAVAEEVATLSATVADLVKTVAALEERRSRNVNAMSNLLAEGSRLAKRIGLIEKALLP